MSHIIVHGYMTTFSNRHTFTQKPLINLKLTHKMPHNSEVLRGKGGIRGRTGGTLVIVWPLTSARIPDPSFVL